MVKKHERDPHLLSQSFEQRLLGITINMFRILANLTSKNPMCRRLICVNSGRDSSQGAMFGVFKLDFDSCERYLDFDIGGSTQTFELDLSSRVVLLGEPFWKNITKY